jgi:hypothetical protein
MSASFWHKPQEPPHPSVPHWLLPQTGLQHLPFAVHVLPTEQEQSVVHVRQFSLSWLEQLPSPQDLTETH